MVTVLLHMIMVIKLTQVCLYKNLFEKYSEADNEEDIEMKNPNRIKNLPDPISIGDACTKKYVINLFNDPSIIKNTAHVDFNDKNLDNVNSIKVSSFLILEEQLTPKMYVNQSEGVDDSSLLRLDPNEKLELDERGFLHLNSTLTSPKTVMELPTKSYVDFKFEDLCTIRALLMLTSIRKISITLDSLK